MQLGLVKIAQGHYMWCLASEDRPMNAVIYLIYTVINLYMWAIIISIIMSWLVQFNVINTRSPIVNSIGNFLHKITEPLLGRIRAFMPDLGGIDLAPLIAILALVFLERLLLLDIAPALM
jgi:YggT family protein